MLEFHKVDSLSRQSLLLFHVSQKLLVAYAMPFSFIVTELRKPSNTKFPAQISTK